jgi:glutaminyl-peptide cyclotransferase
MKSGRGTGRWARLALAAAVIVQLVLSAGCGRPSFDGEDAFALLERQCEFGPRPPGSEAHDAMLSWLVDVLRERSESVSVQRFSVLSEAGRVDMANVIASFRVDARERVLLGAHWDTRAIAEKDQDPEKRALPIPGANDGASGVAVLLELAAMMSERAPAVGVDLVFFDGEDGGNGGGLDEFCLGSTYFAMNMGDYCPGYAVVVDMVGDADLAIPVEANSRAACPEIVELVWSAAERAGANSFSDATGSYMLDDHIPLIQAGVPSALIIDFEYPHWHTHEDTPDKCSPESLAEVGEVLAELVY